MDSRFFPPKSIVRAGRAVYDDNELRKNIAIGAGIIRWGLHPQTISQDGASWMYSIFGIEEIPLHRFFSYQIVGNNGNTIIDRESTVLTYTGCRPYAPYGWDTQIRKEIIEAGRPHGVGNISDSDIKQMLTRFVSWVKTDPVIDPEHNNDKIRLKRIYRGINAVNNAPDGTVIKAIIGDRVRYIQTIDMDVVEETDRYECECGASVWCASHHGEQKLCKMCIAEINGREADACSHWECGFMACDNYNGKEFNNDDWDAMDDIESTIRKPYF